MTLHRSHRAPRSLGVLVTLALGASCSGPQQRDDETLEQAGFHLELARGYFAAGEIPQSIAELYMAIELQPDNADALFLLGFIHQGRMEYRQAEDYYRRAVEADPRRLEIKNNLGTVYLTLEMWEEAEEVFTELVNSPTYVTPGTARNNLGWAVYNQGRVREALEFFEQAALFQPDLCLAYNNAGIAYSDLGVERDAAMRFQSAIDRCESYAEPRYRLALLIAATEPDRALALFTECYELAPESTFGRRCFEYIGGGR